MLKRAVIAMILAVAACGTDGGPDTKCPNDLPPSCPSSSPSYGTQVSAILAAECAGCHSPGGAAPEKDLSTYGGIFNFRSAILNTVYACRMPPLGEPTPTSAERKAVLTWLVCGAPNN